MITCTFENEKKANLRHVVTHVLAIKGSKILLVKRAEGILEAGKWGFPGGFLDQGETLEQCVARELMEETGYEGKVVGLFRINSMTPRRNDQGRNNVAHEFLVEVGKKTGEPDWEQTSVEWKELESLTEEMMAFDHFQTIIHLKKFLKTPFPLPIIV